VCLIVAASIRPEGAEPMVHDARKNIFRNYANVPGMARALDWDGVLSNSESVIPWVL